MDNKRNKAGTPVAALEHFDLIDDTLKDRATTTPAFLEASMDVSLVDAEKPAAQTKRKKKSQPEDVHNSDLEAAFADFVGSSEDDQENTDPSSGSDVECEIVESDRQELVDSIPAKKPTSIPFSKKPKLSASTIAQTMFDKMIHDEREEKAQKLSPEELAQLKEEEEQEKKEKKELRELLRENLQSTNVFLGAAAAALQAMAENIKKG